MDLIDADFSKISRKSGLNFWIVTVGLAQPFVMNFGYKNAMSENHSWNWSRQNFQLKFSFLWILENVLS